MKKSTVHISEEERNGTWHISLSGARPPLTNHTHPSSWKYSFLLNAACFECHRTYRKLRMYNMNIVITIVLYQDINQDVVFYYSESTLAQISNLFLSLRKKIVHVTKFEIFNSKVYREFYNTYKIIGRRIRRTPHQISNCCK